MEIKKIVNKIEFLDFVATWEIVFDRVWDNNTYNWIFNKNNRIYCAIDNGEVVGGYCF